MMSGGYDASSVMCSVWVLQEIHLIQLCYVITDLDWHPTGFYVGHKCVYNVDIVSIMLIYYFVPWMKYTLITLEPIQLVAVLCSELSTISSGSCYNDSILPDNSHIWQSLSLRDWRWKAVVTLGWMCATFSGNGLWPPRGTAIATRRMRI